MKMASRFLVVCVGIVVLVLGFLSAQETAAGLSGTWSGRATKEGAKPYKVTVILDGSGAGFIEYPAMKCGGTLHFVRKTGDTLSYRETITHGKASCAENGRVDVVPNGNVLAWSWSAGEHKASATLSKMEAIALSGCADCDLKYDQDLQACYRIANSVDQQKCQDQAEEDAQDCQGTCKT
jgi:hypothetical protein